jgi:hypothetical protein
LETCKPSISVRAREPKRFLLRVLPTSDILGYGSKQKCQNLLRPSWSSSRGKYE